MCGSRLERLPLFPSQKTHNKLAFCYRINNWKNVCALHFYYTLKRIHKNSLFLEASLTSIKLNWHRFQLKIMCYIRRKWKISLVLKAEKLVLIGSNWKFPLYSFANLQWFRKLLFELLNQFCVTQKLDLSLAFIVNLLLMSLNSNFIDKNSFHNWNVLLFWTEKSLETLFNATYFNWVLLKWIQWV